MNRFGWISMLVGLVFGLLLWTAPPVWAAATCNPNIRATTPTSDFTLDDSNGTATHLKTGLMWMRCALGENWDSGTCTGSPAAYPWGTALRAVRGASFAGHNDWRLPNAKELLSIVKERCYGPSLNETVFPGVVHWYWSSSPYAYDPGYAWHVTFLNGGVNALVKTNAFHVRLVRGGQGFGDYGGGSSAPPVSVTFGPPSGPANPSGSAAEPVNTATGNYYYSHTDLTLPGRGLGLVFTRTYNAQDPTDGPFGRGWTHRYQVRLTENPDGSVIIRHGDGH